MVTELKRMQQRADTTANWESEDPVLLAGEIGVDLTAGRFKLGDGTSLWSELDYVIGIPADLDLAITALAEDPGSDFAVSQSASFGVTLRPSGDTTGVTDRTAINAALDAVGSVRLLDGLFWLDAPIEQTSDTTLILEEATVKLVDGADCNIWRNKNRTTGDYHVSIVGIGLALFDGNAENQTRFGGYRFLDNIGLAPVNINGLRIEGIQIGTTNGWGVFMQGVTYARIHDITMMQTASTTYQDGIDIGVGCHDIHISKVRGNTGDDVCAIFAMQYPSAGFGADGGPNELDDWATVSVPLHPIYQPGSVLPLDIWNITYDDIAVDSNGHSLLRIFSDDTADVYKIEARNLREMGYVGCHALFSTAAASVYSDASHQPAAGCVRDVKVVGASGGSFGAGLAPLCLDSHIDGLYAANLDLPPQGGFPGAVVGTVEAAAGPTIKNVLIDGVKSTRTGSSSVGDVMSFMAGSTIENFTIQNVELAEAQTVLNNAATSVTGLKLRNVRIGKLYDKAFKSATPEVADIRDVVVSSYDAAVSLRGTIGATRAAFKTRTGGDVTLSSTSFASVDTGLDCTVLADVGDVLSIAVNAQMSSGGVALLDAQTMVGGSAVNVVSGGALYGLQGWTGLSGGNVVGAPFLYVVKKGDIDPATGRVLVRLIYKMVSSTKTFYANTNNPAQFSVVNVGPALVG